LILKKIAILGQPPRGDEDKLISPIMHYSLPVDVISSSSLTEIISVFSFRSNINHNRISKKNQPVRLFKYKNTCFTMLARESYFVLVPEGGYRPKAGHPGISAARGVWANLDSP